jgi:hypothetical protein
LFTTTCASVAKLALPRAIALGGAGAWTIFSQALQLYLGRTVRTTRHCTGSTSSISSLSWPSGRSAPPQSGQGAGASFRFNTTLLARQKRRQRPDRCGPVTPVNGGRANVGMLGFALQFLQRQFQLLDLQGQLLGRPAEGEAAKLGKLDAQCRNEAVARRQCRFQLGDPGFLVEDGRSSVRHGELLA